MNCIICDELTENRVEICEHAVCFDCMATHCNTQVADKNYDLICPAKNCETNLSANDIFKYLSIDNHRKYNNSLVESEISKNSRKCAKCGTDRDDLGDKYWCQRCGYTCIDCNERFSSSHYCKLSEIENALKFTDLKRCPKCRIFLTKESGCDAVRCPGCKCKFCWNCLLRLKKMNEETHRIICNEFTSFNENEESDNDSD